MRHTLEVTPALEAAYAGTNCWHVSDAPFDSGIPCGGSGPQRGRCTLQHGHGGIVHIAHLHGGDEHDRNTIYAAWIDGDPDMEMDKGL